MANLSPDATATTESMSIIARRTPTLGNFAYTTIKDGVIVIIVDPNAPGGTAPQVVNAVGQLWPRGDGTPSAT